MFDFAPEFADSLTELDIPRLKHSRQCTLFQKSGYMKHIRSCVVCCVLLLC